MTIGLRNGVAILPELPVEEKIKVKLILETLIAAGMRKGEVSLEKVPAEWRENIKNLPRRFSLFSWRIERICGYGKSSRRRFFTREAAEANCPSSVDLNTEIIEYTANLLEVLFAVYNRILESIPIPSEAPLAADEQDFINKLLWIMK